MWRGVLWFCGELVLILIVLTVFFWMNALPDTRFIPIIVLAILALSDLRRKLEQMDKKLTALAKKLNVDLEEKPQATEKKIILAE